MCYFAELDERSRNRVVVVQERGYWEPIAAGIVRLHPDYRAVATVSVYSWERKG